jgi:RNA polymerase II subunit A-like phosphatase
MFFCAFPAKNGAGPAARKERTPSGRFMDTINPLLSFSMDEIESMGHEVDDICNESESSSSSSDDQEQKKDDDEVFTEKLPLRRRSSRSKSDELATEHKLQKQQSIHESNDKEGLRINKKEEKNSSSSSSSPSSSSSGGYFIQIFRE